MPEPLLFISHKHSDSEIAKVIGLFIEEKSNFGVKVHLSSSPDFDGPRFGPNLNAQLREKLWNTEVLILIYTTADKDWQYCMWECGVATHPKSPDTTIIVLQCGSDIPPPFSDVLRVNVRKPDDIKNFTQQLLLDPQFFPSLDRAIAPGAAKALDKFAGELFDKLERVLPPITPYKAEEWSTWAFLRIELSRTEVEQIENSEENEGIELAHQIIRDHAVVVESNSQAEHVFGQNGFPNNMKFEALFKRWQGKYPNEDGAWFGSCSEQFRMGVRRGVPVILWTPVKEFNGDKEYIPVVSRISQIPFADKVNFDIYFYNLSDPRAVPVTDKMLPIGNFFYKKIEDINPQQLYLKDLVEELDLRMLNRVPLFNADGHPLYIVHRSMIDRFIVKHIYSAGKNGTDKLTLNDLLSDLELKDMFENTFVVVRKQASLAEAKSAMLAKPGCGDVFVTATGARNEPVRGWLTNVDITRNS